MKKLLLIGLIVAVVVGAYGYYMYNKPPEGVSGKKPDFTTTPAQLLADFTTDEAAANAKYLGKVVQVQGRILEIVPGDGLQMQVFLDSGDFMSRVSCVMEEDYEKFLERKLKKDDVVTIKGECTGMLDDIIMERCVVVGEEG